MKVTGFTECSLRALIYLGRNRQRLVTVDEILLEQRVSRSLLTKAVHQLGEQGWIVTVRGRSGGMRLAHEPDAIALGAVVRQSEADFHMAICFDGDHGAGSCRLSADCRLRGWLGDATAAYLRLMDGKTLAQLLEEPQENANTDYF